MSDLQPYLPNLLLAYATYLVAAASPGPSNLAIMAVAMSQGRRAALTLALGVLTGSMTWAVLAALGVSAVLASYAGALTALKIAGGMYMLWLCLKSARSALRADVADAARAGASRTLYWRGLAMHLTNPKAVLAWIAVIALGLPQGAPRALSLAIVGGCALLGCCIFCGYALLFSSAAMARAYRRARRWIEGGLAAVFGLAGVKLLLSQA